MIAMLAELRGTVLQAEHTNNGERLVILYSAPLVENIDRWLRVLGQVDLGSPSESAFDAIPTGDYRWSASVSVGDMTSAIKTALEHPTTDARVLLGRILTELERKP